VDKSCQEAAILIPEMATWDLHQEIIMGSLIKANQAKVRDARRTEALNTEKY